MTQEALRHGTWVSPELAAFAENREKFYVRTQAMAQLLLEIHEAKQATYERFV